MTQLSTNKNSYPLYLWHKAKLYRGCMLVVELFEGRYYPHYFDQFGDLALLDDAPVASIEAALDIARLAVDAHIEQAIRDGQHLPVLDAVV